MSFSPRDKRNACLNAVGETLWGLQANMVAASTVLTVLLRSFGAGARSIGCISAVELGGAMLPQFLGAYLFRSRRNLKRSLILVHVLGLSPILAFMSGVTFFSPHLPAPLSRALLLGAFVAFVTVMGTMLAAWWDWIAHIFDVRIRGRVMGFSFFGSALAGSVGASLAGWLIRHVPAPACYGWLYLIASVLSLCSLISFAFFDDPATRLDGPAPVAAERALGSNVRRSLGDRNFRRYLAGRILAIAGFCIAPFIAVRYARPEWGGLSAGVIVSCGAGMAAGQAFGNLTFGHLGDSYGHRLGIRIGAAMQVVTMLIAWRVPGLAGCALTYAAAGICSGAWVSHTNLMIETCPHASRAAHISAANLLLAPFGIALPLLAGVVAARWGTSTLFVASLGFSVAAFVWFGAAFRDPRSLLRAEAGISPSPSA